MPSERYGIRYRPNDVYFCTDFVSRKPYWTSLKKSPRPGGDPALTDGKWDLTRPEVEVLKYLRTRASGEAKRVWFSYELRFEASLPMKATKLGKSDDRGANTETFEDGDARSASSNSADDVGIENAGDRHGGHNRRF
jgi:hypothetical protein